MSASKRDALGDRIKGQYEDRTRYKLPRRTYTILRVDGQAFHTLTRNADKPFDQDIVERMNRTAVTLCEEIHGAKFAYVQSDEISVLLTDFTSENTAAWFDGNVQKMASVGASIATAEFNGSLFGGYPARFDARVFTIPDYVEVENYVIWRQKDAIRNAVQMIARASFSHRECLNKSNSQLLIMLAEKGIAWESFVEGLRYGRLIRRVIFPRPHTETSVYGYHSPWVVEAAPVFVEERDRLTALIPKPWSDA